MENNKLTEEDKSEQKKKSKFTEADDMILLIKKKSKQVKDDRNSVFRNNYKNYQYDYEEDFYEPR